jgi:hypothetical protein
MSKRDDLIIELIPILNDPEKLEKYIIENSNLPGPRGNLELAFTLAELYDDFNVLSKWIEITQAQADVNDPRSFLVFCATVCLGRLYVKKKDNKIITILKKLANDGRWRIREAVAFGFQIIGEQDFNELVMIFSEWINKSNNLEKRAILASLAHPKFLDEKRAEFCFKITDIVLKRMDRDNDFDVLRKGLEFTISIFVAANLKIGFHFIEKWIGKDKNIDKIMVKNLKKNRIAKKNPKEVEDLLNKI